MEKNMQQREWEETISKMSYNELQEYITAPNSGYPEFLELAEERLKELKTEDMRNTVIKIMADMGYESEFDEDGYFPFSLNTDNKDYFQVFDSEEEKSFINDVRFTISFDYDLRYIEIAENCWKKVELDQVEEVERLKRAINQSNFGYNVVTAYWINEEEQTIEVNSNTSYPYLPNEAYLKDCFDLKIKEILCKNWFINRYLEEDRKK